MNRSIRAEVNSDSRSPPSPGKSGASAQSVQARTGLRTT
jgi:hypothetical protein